MCGGTIDAGAPTTASFIHGFFSITQLGKFALAGASLVARWGVPDLFDVHNSAARFDPDGVAADLFLYVLYNRTVGHGVLNVTGDDGSGALVFAHCAAAHTFADNGTVTLLVANPSASPVSLGLPMPTLPRLEYVLTAPSGNMSSHHPVLNGRTQVPLRLAADGSLPPMEPVFCSSAAATSTPASGCGEVIQLQARSQAFVVLLAASLVDACR